MDYAKDREYRYVGPDELNVYPIPTGSQITTLCELDSWITSNPQDEQCEPFTYVIHKLGGLGLAPRRSEHVACAGGKPVLGAGEVTFGRSNGKWEVRGVNNLSTGYCPDVTSWSPVRESFRRINIRHPDNFTDVFAFRRCPACFEINLVKDSYFICVFCGTDLPQQWNIDT